MRQKEKRSKIVRNPWERRYRTTQRAAIEFRALLDTARTENEIHQFLVNNFFLFFNCLGNVTDPGAVYSKVRLGSNHEVDFVAYFDKTSGRYWTFIELERPDVPLFTSKGNPSQFLTHGLRQIHDWQNWVAENLTYARSFLTDVIDPIGALVIGRRRTITDSQAKLLRRMLSANPRMEIMTYDRLLNIAWLGLTGWREVKVGSHASLIQHPPPPCDINKYQRWERKPGTKISDSLMTPILIGKDGYPYTVDPTQEWDAKKMFTRWSKSILKKLEDGNKK